MIEKLPKYILMGIVKECFSVDEIGKLDTSFCNQKNYSNFVNFVMECNIDVCYNPLRPATFSFIKWLFKRNVDIFGLYLKNDSILN